MWSIIQNQISISDLDEYHDKKEKGKEEKETSECQEQSKGTVEIVIYCIFGKTFESVCG